MKEENNIEGRKVSSLKFEGCVKRLDKFSKDILKRIFPGLTWIDDKEGGLNDRWGKLRSPNPSDGPAVKIISQRRKRSRR